jgi:preprotein translocase subunit YajC
MLASNLVLAQAGGVGAAFLIQLLAIVAIFYFLLIMPQRREAKRHREMLAALKRGDQVATMGGLIGEIINLNDEVVQLKTGDARVNVERARIARMVTTPVPK